MATGRTLLVLALLGPIPLAAQVRHEWVVQVVGVTGRPAAAVAGAGWAPRIGYRDRAQVFLGAGGGEDGIMGRAEATWHFMLAPSRPGGLGIYAGGGVAGEASRTSRARVVLMVGAERNPAGRRGWMAEVGVGGGLRVALGIRWRKG